MMPQHIPRCWTPPTSQQGASDPDTIDLSFTSDEDEEVEQQQQPPQEEEAEEINVAEIEENTTALRNFVAAWEVIASRGPGNSVPSKYHGVCKHMNTGRFEGSLQFQKRRVYLGGFLDAHTAARAHDVMALYCRGPGNDVMNFLEVDYASILPHLNPLSQAQLIAEFKNFAKRPPATSSARRLLHHAASRVPPGIPIVQQEEEEEMEEEDDDEDDDEAPPLSSVDHVSKKRQRSGPLPRYSPYKGVTRNKKRWQANINIPKSGRKKAARVYLGTFSDDKDAARVVDRACLVVLGRNAELLNFPLEDYSTDPFILEHGLKDQDTFLKLLRESHTVRPRESRLMNDAANINQISSEADEEQQQQQQQGDDVSIAPTEDMNGDSLMEEKGVQTPFTVANPTSATVAAAAVLSYSQLNIVLDKLLGTDSDSRLLKILADLYQQGNPSVVEVVHSQATSMVAPEVRIAYDAMVMETQQRLWKEAIARAATGVEHEQEPQHEREEQPQPLNEFQHPADGDDAATTPTHNSARSKDNETPTTTITSTPVEELPQSKAIIDASKGGKKRKVNEAELMVQESRRQQAPSQHKQHPVARPLLVATPPSKVHRKAAAAATTTTTFKGNDAGDAGPSRPPPKINSTSLPIGQPAVNAPTKMKYTAHKSACKGGPLAAPDVQMSVMDGAIQSLQGIINKLQEGFRLKKSVSLEEAQMNLCTAKLAIATKIKQDGGAYEMAHNVWVENGASWPGFKHTPYSIWGGTKVDALGLEKIAEMKKRGLTMVPGLECVLQGKCAYPLLLTNNSTLIPGGKGYGLISLGHIPGAAAVLEYQGEYVNAAEEEARKKTLKAKGIVTAESLESCYCFDLEYVDAPCSAATTDKRRHTFKNGIYEGASSGELTCTVLDARRQGNVSRFINHSCEPNLSSREVLSLNGPRKVLFFSLRDITAGEETGIDYAEDWTVDSIKTAKKEWEQKEAHRDCHCETDGCRGWTF